MSEVSIIMPVFNGACFIKDAIDSILCQTFHDFELVIVNDGSTDDSVAIIKKYTDPRIRLINRNVNLGLALTRNEGVAAARGKYVAMLDCDDIARHDRLRKQVDFLDNNPGSGLVGSWVEIIDEEGNATGKTWKYQTSAEKIPATLLFHNCFAQSSVMMRKDILPNNPYRQEYPPAEDYDLWVRLSEKTLLGNIPLPLVQYRLHAGGTSRKRLLAAEENTLKVILEQLLKLGVDWQEEDILLHRMAALARSQSDLTALISVEKWLLRLARANSVAAVYKDKPFLDVLNLRWFVSCMASSCLGWDAFRLYRASSLCDGSGVSRSETFKFAVRCLFKI